MELCTVPRDLHWEREWLGHIVSLSLTPMSLCRSGVEESQVLAQFREGML